MNTFEKWVSNYGGPDKLAVDLGVSSLTVRYWLAKKGRPKTATTAKLVKLSKGKLSFETIIKCTQPVEIK